MSDSDMTDTQLARDQFVRGLRRWWRAVALAAAVGGLAAFVVSKALPATYRSTAQLFVAPASVPAAAIQDVILGQNLARSYVQLAGADVILEPAMRRIGWTDLASFRDRTTILQIRDTFVITISFQLDDPTRAAAAANATAEAFVERSAALQSSLRGTVTIWQPAAVPAEPEAPRVLLNTLVGMVLASLGAVLWALFLPHPELRLPTRRAPGAPRSA